MKKDFKKYLIYLRYSLPIVTVLSVFGMLFVPSHFLYFADGETKLTEYRSSAQLFWGFWNNSREMLFGSENLELGELSFARILFVLIIVLFLAFAFSLAVSIWSAIVSFYYFLSDNEDSAEYYRRIFCVFIPNRILLCIFTSVGCVVAILPYLVHPIYNLIGANVQVTLIAPDGLIVGGVLTIVTIALSIVCAPIERAFDADVFKKDKQDAKDDLYDNDDDEDEYDNGDDSFDSEANERIRRLFEKKDDNKKY